MIKGNFWERTARKLVLNLIAPCFGTALGFVLEFYLGKLQKHIGPNGIWVAVKLNPQTPASPPIVYAKKRTRANRMKTLKPWEISAGNII